VKCEQCRADMTVINLSMNDDKTKCQQEFGCSNQNCTRFIGVDANNPKSITIKGPWITL
jgi:hypothetical protein